MDRSTYYSASCSNTLRMHAHYHYVRVCSTSTWDRAGVRWPGWEEGQAPYLPPPAPNKPQTRARIWGCQFPTGCEAGARKQFRSDHPAVYEPQGPFTSLCTNTFWPSNNIPPELGCLFLGSVGTQSGSSRFSSVLFGARGSLTAPAVFLATIHPLSSSHRPAFAPSVSHPAAWLPPQDG